MRALLCSAALALLLPTGIAEAQGLKACNGLNTTTAGVRASLKTSTAMEAGNKVVNLSLQLTDVASGQAIANPTLKTPMGKKAEVTVSEGALTISFNPQPSGLASSVDVKFIGADGQNKTVAMKCGL